MSVIICRITVSSIPRVTAWLGQGCSLLLCLWFRFQQQATHACTAAYRQTPLRSRLYPTKSLPSFSWSCRNCSKAAPTDKSHGRYSTRTSYCVFLLNDQLYCILFNPCLAGCHHFIEPTCTLQSVSWLLPPHEFLCCIPHRTKKQSQRTS